MANDVIEYRIPPNASITLKYDQVYFRVLNQGETIKAIVNFDIGLVTLIISNFDVFGAMVLTDKNGKLLRRVYNQLGKILKIV